MKNSESMSKKKTGFCSRICRRKCKTVFNFISAVLIPVLLGVFTVILALQQESIAKTNRAIDLQIAAEQYKQNFELAVDDQRNVQLTAYIHEVSDLLLANNFSLNKEILKSIIRPKTLATLRQLDTKRKGYLLQFLHESHLMSILNPPYLNLIEANFNNIQIGSVDSAIDMRHTSFSHAYFVNTSFIFISCGYCDFSYCRLREASFHAVSFEYGKFLGAKLQKVDFSESSFYKADFSAANMTDAKISEKQISRAGSISASILPDGRRGRNSNLFIDRNCQKLVNDNNIQQNVNISQFRAWLMKMEWTSAPIYIFSGWFDKINELRVNFTEFNRNGVVLQKYCYVNKDLVMNMTGTHFCFVNQWSNSSAPFSNYTNQYKYVVEKINCHNETYFIHVNIILGQYGTCQDVHFSIETLP